MGAQYFKHSCEHRRREAMLGGSRGMLPQKCFEKWYNSVHSRAHFSLLNVDAFDVVLFFIVLFLKCCLCRQV